MTSSRPRILVTSDCTLCPHALDPLRQIGQVDYLFPATAAQVEPVLHQYDAIMCDASIKFDQALLSRASMLRIIATPSTGTDHVDKQFLARRGIELIDLAREYELIESFTATAEGTWALLLACVRRLPRSFERAKAGCIGLEDRSWAPRQLSGKTLGIIGCGRVGGRVARFGNAFSMRVLAHDIRPLDEPGVEQTDLDALLAQSDVISLHLHLTEQTRGFIDRDRLARMKRGVVLVNTARGDLIDETALVESLHSGHVGAAGLDVVHDEWDPNLASHPLHEYARTHDNLVLTPHVASACYESITGARVFVAARLAERLRAIPRSTHENRRESMTEADLNKAVREFDTNGFTVLRGFLTAAEVEEVNQRTQRYVSDVVPTLPKEEVFYEVKDDPKTLKQLSRIDQRDEFFRKLFTGERLLSLARSLLHEDVVPCSMQWLNKPPGAGQESPPHQDGYYFRIQPNEALTFWLALDPVNEENGCLRYVPGSHKRGVLPHERSQTLGFSQSLVGYGAAERAAEVAIHASPGDLIAHHSLTIHRADPNLSARPRRALTAVYFSVRAKRDEAALSDYQNKLKQELASTGKI
jgi:phytanoyl-CoA hydroxylase